MATVAQQPRRARAGQYPPNARVLLQPIAAPSVLGYFALASALMIYGPWFAGSWGGPTSPGSFFPFLLLFGGVGQLAAAMWSYRARNGVAAALHGSWAAFWLGVSVMYLLATTHTITVPPPGAQFESLGQWFIYMAVVTWTTALAALARSPGGFLAQATLATAATIAAPALIVGSSGWTSVAGWVMVAAACAVFYQGAALMLDNVYGIVVLPLLHWHRGNLPGSSPAEPVQFEQGDPGVKVGQ
jgi:succinate-acetate transporter protein